jgi:GTP pyrophosphokinase
MMEVFMDDAAPKLASRFEEALIFASQLHAGQTRKATNTPYLAHLLSVTALVLEADGDEDMAIAALLHDAVEDQGGLETLAEIRHRFGSRVAEIVDSCTDAYTNPKPPWRQRKEDYLIHLQEAQPDAQLVSLADKLHNARCILRDLRQQGDSVWEKFNGGKSGTLWYYRSLVSAFKEMEGSFLVDELERTVTEIERLAGI